MMGDASGEPSDPGIQIGLRKRHRLGQKSAAVEITLGNNPKNVERTCPYVPTTELILGWEV